MRKAQAAMEFLMTYGWAILVVLVAISSLAYFGILSPDKFLPERCSISTGSGLFCEQFSVSQGEIKLRIKNTLGEQIIVTEAALSKEGESCSLNAPTSIAAGGSADIMLNTGTNCANLTAPGKKLKGDLSITYTRRSFPKTTEGSLISKITESIAPPLPQGYVSYWKFDAEAERITPDEAGVNDGTLMNNSIIVSDIEKGNVLNLDGEWDFVSVADDVSLDITDSITISTWIKLKSFKSSKIVIKPFTGGGEPWELYALDFRTPENYARFIISNGSIGEWYGVWNSSYSLLLNQWYHVVGTYNKNVMKLYLDSQEVEAVMNNYNGTLNEVSQVNIDIGTNDEPLLIGAYSSLGVNSFNGSIDKTMIYDRALSETEILDIYNAQKPVCTNDIGCIAEGSFCEGNLTYTCTSGAGGCLDRVDGIECGAEEICQAGICIPTDYVSYWKFDEQIDMGTYNMTPDETGVNNGTLNDNAVTVYDSERDHSGETNGYVLNLDGTGDHVDVGDSPSYSPYGEMGEQDAGLSIFTWVKSDGIKTGQILFFKSFEYGCRNDGEDLECSAWGSAATIYYYASKSDILPAGWHHVGYVLNYKVDETGNLTLYVDGVNVTVDTTNDVLSMLARTFNFRVGHSLFEGLYFNGTIDDVMIYNRTLSETEIQNIYCWQGGTALFCT